MALGYPEAKQLATTIIFTTGNGRFPWKRIRSSRKWYKQCLHRKERRRAVVDPECLPMYRRNSGWEW